MSNISIVTTNWLTSHQPGNIVKGPTSFSHMVAVHELPTLTLAITSLRIRRLGESPATRDDSYTCEQSTRYSRKSSGRNEYCLAKTSEDASRSRVRSSVARYLRKSTRYLHPIRSYVGIGHSWPKSGTTLSARRRNLADRGSAKSLST